MSAALFIAHLVIEERCLTSRRAKNYLAAEKETRANDLVITWRKLHP